MRLVLRRARQARGLLLAAAVAALVATVLVGGLADYNRRAIEVGRQSLIQNAAPTERTLLVSGSGGDSQQEFARRDAAIRDYARDLGGRPTDVHLARTGTGRELTAVSGATDEPVFATLVTLPDLPDRAELTEGRWPASGASPTQVALPDRVARTLGVRPGDRVPLLDRLTKRPADVLVTGVWRPRADEDPYWLLVPGVSGTGPAYGPFALTPDDFAATFTGGTSASWLIRPDLAGAGGADLAALDAAAGRAATELPDTAGLGSSAQVTSQLGELAARAQRADLVGRSTMLTPILLVLLLGGYALVLVAALLNQDRRGQTALLRARGAGRGQLAGLAVREAALVVLPAALLAPPLAGQAVRLSGWGDLPAVPLGTRLTWLVAAGLAIACVLLMVGPALRRAGTYVADLAARSRPDRRTAVQRAGVDLALVALAVIAWFQLRQYASPLAGGGGVGIDPLLAAAPTLGVLAGAVIALRLLPPVTRLAERLISRRSWPAAVLGVWQAGRRPHAGPVLLLAIAVGTSTLAWSLVGTWERSLVDQADTRVGADLRLLDEAAPAGRAAQIAALPGVERALPVWRERTRLGRDGAADGAAVEATVVGIDTSAAAGLVRMRADLVDGRPAGAFDPFRAARRPVTGVALPPGGGRLTGELRMAMRGGTPLRPPTVNAVLVGADGLTYRVALAGPTVAEPPVGGDRAPGGPASAGVTSFAGDVPDTGGRPLLLAGFEVQAGSPQPRVGTESVDYDLTIGDVRVAGAPLDLEGGQWTSTDGGAGTADAVLAGAGLRVRYGLPIPGGWRPNYTGWGARLPPPVRLGVIVRQPTAPVPAMATPDVLAALAIGPGDTTRIALSGVDTEVTVVGVLAAIPGSGELASGLLLDLPTLAGRMIAGNQPGPTGGEWWLATTQARHAEAADAAHQLAGVTVLDRVTAARESGGNPYWRAARTGLLVAALGAVLLALVGLAVDVWATARRRVGELAVLNTLGAPPRLLARSLLAEQGFLAGAGVAAGIAIGAAVAATLAPLVILTPAAARPVPAPVLAVPWLPVLATAGVLFGAALLLGALTAATVRQRVAAVRLRMAGE